MDFKNYKMQVLIKVLRFLQASYLKFIRMRLVLSQDKALIINLNNLKCSKVIQLLNNWRPIIGPFGVRSYVISYDS